MAWTVGSYVKSALSSTRLWVFQPIKRNDWDSMPKYAENPLEKFKPKKQVSPEKLKLIKETRQKLSSLGLLRESK